MLKDNRTESPQ